MEKYKNLNGNSNVDQFEIGDDYISVKFSKTTKIYTYSYDKAGEYHVEELKQLARRGSGLNSYIMRKVKDLYD